MKKILIFCIPFILITTHIFSNSEIPSNFDLFENKTIVVLGGTGYLGKGITTELLKYNPKKIVIFSRDEVKHFNLTKIFNNNPKIQSIIGDIRDYESVLRATHGAEIVFHVAALKRMDALEHNVEESVKTNILGSINVFNACVANNIPKVLFISTDKACLPVNAYGACKFMSEKIFTNYDRQKIHTQFMVARFGNILESTGSIIPIFLDKIKSGQEVPLTDARMTRFIIDKVSAAELLFDALRYGAGGEIFVRKLPSLKVTDLIEVLKNKLAANNPIKVIGLRPGEKIHEVLINQSEMARAILFEDYLIVKPSVDTAKAQDQESLPMYMKQGKTINQDSFIEYSSDLAIISQEDLGKLLEKLGLL